MNERRQLILLVSIATDFGTGGGRGKLDHGNAFHFKDKTCSINPRPPSARFVFQCSDKVRHTGTDGILLSSELGHQEAGSTPYNAGLTHEHQGDGPQR